MAFDKLRERHIDRLLSEEFESSLDFAGWVAQRVFADRAPAARPCDCTSTIGHYRSQGETDIRVKMRWVNGEEAVLHIEDKLDAPPQPEQAERYAIAVDKESTNLTASLLVAPDAWIRRHPMEVGIYGSVISLGQVAAYLKERAVELSRSEIAGDKEIASRLRWRVDTLTGATRRRSVLEAIRAGSITEWNAAAAEVIDAACGLVLQVRERQRSEGRQKESRFIRFGETLSKNADGNNPILKLKTRNAKNSARVSLEVKAGASKGALSVQASATGYHVEESKTGTLIITASSPEMKRLTIQEPVKGQVDRLEGAAAVAQNLIEWWENTGVHATWSRG